MLLLRIDFGLVENLAAPLTWEVAPPAWLSHPLFSARALGQNELARAEVELVKGFESLIWELMVFKMA